MSYFDPIDVDSLPEPEPRKDDLEEWLGRAFAELDVGNEATAWDAINRVAGDCAPGSPSCARLAALLVAQVGECWTQGWQPADLHRVTARQIDNVACDVLGDAMVDHLGQFAAVTVHPRWHEQLLAVEAARWWPPAQDYLSSRLRQADVERAVIIGALIRVAHLLQRLPQLALLDPLPGTYIGRRDRTSQGKVEQRILVRVRQLLAKAESTNFEAEAETFTAGAQALMARHSIDAAMLADSGAVPDQTTLAIRIGIDRPYEKPKAVLLGAVADANRCRSVWSNALGFATVVGFPDDVRATETLFTSLLVQAARSMTTHGSRQRADGGSRTRSFRSSFLTSFALRIGERLAQVTREQTAEASATRTGGRDLVRVLADRSQEVTDATARLFPDQTYARVSGGSDAEGWYAGRRAADDADVGAGPAVGPQ